MSVTVTPDKVLEAKEESPGILDEIKVWLKKPIVQGALLVVATLVAAYLPLFKYVYRLWFEEKDSYYSHGALIPLLSIGIIYSNRDKLRDIPYKPNILGAILAVVAIYVAWAASRTSQFAALSVLFVFNLLCSALFIGGWRWLRALAVPSLYMLFGLPVWQSIIDKYTTPLQLISTQAAFKILELTVGNTLRIDSTTLAVNNFELNVGVPCSGLRLLIAVGAFMAFFIVIARLPAWKNAILAALVLPLCVAVNGLRIAMIGIVGGEFGGEAGHQFHDYSGYISLIVCFLALKWLTDTMEGKQKDENPV